MRRNLIGAARVALALALVVPTLAAANGGPALAGEAAPGVGPIVLPAVNGRPNVVNVQTVGMTTGIVRWSGQTVTFLYNNSVLTPASIANLESGSDPRTAANAGAQAWEDNSAFNFVDGGTTATQSTNGADGINLFTFENTATNVTAVGGAIAVAKQSFNSALNFTDVDIIFNPAMNFSTLGSASNIDVQSVACHEYGHAFGLNHSALLSATMYPFTGAGELHQRTLTADDIAGMQALYMEVPHFWDTGVITGTVTKGGSNLYGAHVVARSLVDGTTVSAAISEPNGTYTMWGVPTGPVLIYAEPLDGPVGDTNITSTYYATGKDTSFTTTVLGGLSTPTPIQVEPGVATSGVNVALNSATSAINPTFIGEVAGPGMAFTVDSTGIELAPGVSTFIVVGGTGISSVADSGFTMSGAGITFGPTSVQSGSLGGGITYKMFAVTVAADAPAGSRDINISSGGDLAIFCAPVEIVPPSTAQASAFAYGAGSTGSGGVPVLSAVNSPTLGNMAFTIAVSNGPASGTAYFYAAAEADYSDKGQGLIQWIRVEESNLFSGMLFQASIAAGTTSFSMSIANNPGLAGFKVYVQCVMTDSGVMSGAASTNALVLTLN